ncbi:hypothetical protein [Nocardioides aurantiacus]|uniref:hypothetical protein n=1 Tax=Nocardioides aurantiacus TaxID=86796 RepID=UPI00403FB600
MTFREESTVRRRDTWSKLLLGVAAVVVLSSCSTNEAATTDGQGTDSPTLTAQAAGPPWPVPVDVADRVAAAGLDLGPMGTAAHYHPLLRIVIDGREVPVAANIGVDPTTGAMSALHTHEGDGTVHIEADDPDEVFTLGQLFEQWGVPLTASRIGNVRAAAGESVELTSNGKTVPGEPGRLELRPDQQIVLELRSK